MYRTSSVIIENKPLQVSVLLALSGLIFPIMTGVLYIIPYIGYLLLKHSCASLS